MFFWDWLRTTFGEEVYYSSLGWYSVTMLTIAVVFLTIGYLKRKSRNNPNVENDNE